MKTVIKLLLLVGLVIYLVFAFVNFTRHGDKTICHRVNYTIADSLHAGFITADEADRLLRKSACYPVGRRMEDIRVQDIEDLLRRNAYIDSVSCYKSPNGTVNVLIEQRIPLLRVMADTGEQYYLDSQGNIMSSQGYVADLVVVTGHVTPQYARKRLVNMGRYLRDNPFWDNQIEQIDVRPNGHLTLVPRVGGHTIQFGTTDSIVQKFRNLQTFYQKVLPTVGWNKYSEISVEHVSQIVGRKTRS